jgi:hypothetical protein
VRRSIDELLQVVVVRDQIMQLFHILTIVHLSKADEVDVVTPGPTEFHDILPVDLGILDNHRIPWLDDLARLAVNPLEVVHDDTPQQRLLDRFPKGDSVELRRVEGDRALVYLDLFVTGFA